MTMRRTEAMKAAIATVLAGSTRIDAADLHNVTAHAIKLAMIQDGHEIKNDRKSLADAYMGALPGTAQQIQRRAEASKSTVERYTKYLLNQGYIETAGRELGPAGSWRTTYRATGKELPAGWRPPEVKARWDDARKMRDEAAGDVAQAARRLMAGLFGGVMA